MTFISKITYVIDEVFKIACIFLACLVWTLYVKKELLPALTFACLLTIVILFLLHFIVEKKSKDRKEKLTKQKDYENFLYNLKLSPPKKKLDFFKNVFDSYFLENNYLIKEDDVIFPFYEVLTIDELLSICSIFEDKKSLTIICLNYDNQTEITSKKIKPLAVKLVNYKTFYLEHTDCCKELTSTLKISNEKLYTFKLILISALSSDKSKKYFTVSLILILSMFFTPYKLLYAILSSLSLSLSLISKLNSQKN